MSMRVCVTTLGALLTLGAGGCGGEPSGDTVEIAAMFTLSGDTRDVQSTRGARLAVDEINARGGVRVGGRRLRVRLHFVDDRSEPQVAVARANEVVNRDRVVALLGPSKSVVAVPVGAVAERAGVPMITPASTSPATTRGRRFVFRTTFTDNVQGAVAARFAREELRARTAAVLYEATSPYNSGLAEAFQQAFRAQGGTVVRELRYTVDQDDPTRGLARLRARAPDVLYLPNAAPDVELQGRRTRRLGLKAILLGGDAWDINRLRDVPAFDGSYATTLWSADTKRPRPRAFVRSFIRTYGSPPTAYAASSYDAVQLITAALQRAGVADTQAVRAELDAVDVHEGAVGRLRFGETGDPQTGAVVLAIRGGRTSSTWELPSAADPGTFNRG